MEKRKRNRRNVWQYLALFVALATSIIRLVLFYTGVAYAIPEATLTLWTFTAYGLAIALLMISYLFPKNVQLAK